ncbi:hypothetical protein [Herbidospora cretacea]|uniref:hypothetical protein n=1 Tax=Herbidospora cretacea TaxID=28444 RepID=UPI000A6007A4|nr:hypothetical protein [Herbidospora cretacea]
MFRRLLTVFLLTATSLVGVVALPAHADKTFRGEGDDVIRIKATRTPGLITFAHTGESNFIVHTINPKGKKNDLLVNEIGDWSGTVLYNASNSFADPGTAGLQIQADGPWTATFKPVSKARCWCSATIRGEGSQVLKLTPTRGLRTMNATHNGTSNFIVYGFQSLTDHPDLLINKIGKYRGKVLLTQGTRLVSVDADGVWVLRRN